jgi:hypothetical protein
MDALAVPPPLLGKLHLETNRIRSKMSLHRHHFPYDQVHQEVRKRCTPVLLLMTLHLVAKKGKMSKLLPSERKWMGKLRLLLRKSTLVTQLPVQSGLLHLNITHMEEGDPQAVHTSWEIVMVEFRKVIVTRTQCLNLVPRLLQVQPRHPGILHPIWECRDLLLTQCIRITHHTCRLLI